MVLAIMNAGGLRKNEIAAGELRASDIFELLPFENALIAIDLTGVQLAKVLEIVPRDAQAGARIHFKWNDRERAEFISGKLVDERDGQNGPVRKVDVFDLDLEAHAVPGDFDGAALQRASVLLRQDGHEHFVSQALFLRP